MKQLLRGVGLVALVLAFQHAALANNVLVSNIALTGQNTTSNFTLVQFDITWQNSWRVSVGPSNHDACWVFVKYSTDGGATWSHATLATSGQPTPPSGSAIDPSSDGKGVFIYRSSDGTGTVNFTGVQLKWDYGADGVADNAVVALKVVAIEMVFVPTTAFSVGSGGTETGHFFEGGGNNPFQITSEGAITVGNSAGQLFYSSDGDQGGPIPAAFPKGFSAFYCMKYEITQEQYKDFLNCLTYDEQDTRTATAPNSAAGTGALSSLNGDRNGIDIQTPGVASSTPALYANNLDGDSNFNESVDGQNIACNSLSWMDGCAYADWAALRPMTELEFEKACRGNQPPLANEFAWGTIGIASSAYTLTNAGAANEDIASNYATTPGDGNISYGTTDGSINGPLRVGIFAGNADNTTDHRVRSGAGFYGIMEMTGNVRERPVTIGNSAGRDFIGTLGDGALSANGNATNSDWPGFGGVDVTGAAGSGSRGGSWINSSSNARVSARNNASISSSSRSGVFGFRCVRPAN